MGSDCQSDRRLLERGALFLDGDRYRASTSCDQNSTPSSTDSKFYNIEMITKGMTLATYCRPRPDGLYVNMIALQIWVANNVLEMFTLAKRAEATC